MIKNTFTSSHCFWVYLQCKVSEICSTFLSTARGPKRAKKSQKSSQSGKNSPKYKISSKNILPHHHCFWVHLQCEVSEIRSTFLSRAVGPSRGQWGPPRSKRGPKNVWPYSALAPLRPALWWTVAWGPQSQPYVHSEIEK